MLTHQAPPPFSTGLGGPPQPLRSTISRADLQVRVTWLFANLPRGEPLAGTFQCRNVQSQQEQGYSQAFLPPRLPTTRLGPLASRREFRPSSLQPLIRYRCKCFPARTYSHCALAITFYLFYLLFACGQCPVFVAALNLRISWEPVLTLAFML